VNTPLERIKLDLKWSIASRKAVIFLAIAFLISDIFTPLFIAEIYSEYQIPGWNLNQILFIYGTWMLIEGLFVTFFGNIMEIGGKIKDGQLDYDLIRPKGILKINGLTIFVPSINDIIVGLILISLFITEMKPKNDLSTSVMDLYMSICSK